MLVVQCLWRFKASPKKFCVRRVKLETWYIGKLRFYIRYIIWISPVRNRIRGGLIAVQRWDITRVNGSIYYLWILRKPDCVLSPRNLLSPVRCKFCIKLPAYVGSLKLSVTRTLPTVHPSSCHRLEEKQSGKGRHLYYGYRHTGCSTNKYFTLYFLALLFYLVLVEFLF